MKIGEMIADRNGVFQGVEANASVTKALGLMSGHSVSAVVVFADLAHTEAPPLGIFTERDLLRCHMIHPGRPLEEIRVNEVMTSNLIVADPDDSVPEAMAMMIKAGIRHLPVISRNRVVDLLGVEDLVRKHVGALNKELHYLKDYITDLQDAAHD
ncbi:MAG: CBS domain-containing protein [Desulfobacterales bacterium]|nr:CBS domain-containing protein [Desulfobacterales bacterium]